VAGAPGTDTSQEEKFNEEKEEGFNGNSGHAACRIPATEANCARVILRIDPPP
jgi:hypothetical protein